MNLVDPLIKDELINVAKCMVIDKVPRLNGVEVKFYICFWDLINGNYWQMISLSLVNFFFSMKQLEVPSH
jgi:hypothetical protein